MKQNIRFKKELDKLNPAQRRAVNLVEGSSMVLAGPGTGKTQLIAARIGNILQQTDTDPSAILCLTYTDAGSVAMRRRLLKLIGPTAYQINIHTFHSFCRKIINENLSYFKLEEVEIATPLEKITIVRSILNELPHNHFFRDQRRPYTWVNGLIELFELIKKEGWSLEGIEHEVNSYLASLPSLDAYRYKRNGKGFKKGDLKTKEIQKTTEQLQRLVLGTQLFAIYKSKMLDSGLYDYEDMLLWVRDAFMNDADLLLQTQEQFLYFLVDEFQDTSNLQNQILNILISYWNQPNVMVVGDDNQCIYEFQGASIENLIAFKGHFSPDKDPILLETNYRSSQELLNHSFSLISNNTTDNTPTWLPKQKPLDAFFKHSAAPRIVAYENTFQETVGIYERIKALLEQGVSASEIAVIYSKHALADDLVELLGQNKIPFEVKKQINVFELSCFQELWLFFQFCNTEYKKPYSGESLLFRMLHLPYFEISFADIRKLTLLAQQDSIISRQSFFNLLEQETFIRTHGFSKPEKLIAFFEFVEQILKNFQSLSGPKWVEATINLSGMTLYYAHKKVSPIQIQGLHTLLDFIKTEAKKHEWHSAAKTFEVLTKMRQERIKLPIINHYFQTDSIKLLTAHSSKGLEFEHVFIMHCTKSQWEERKAKNAMFVFPPALSQSTSSDDLASSRRLFYVAMTRAKKSLEISYPQTFNEGKNATVSRFIQELDPQSQLKVTNARISRTSLELAVLQLVQKSEAKVNIFIEEKEVQKLVEGHVFSIASLELFYNCPIRFFYTYILKIPNLKSTEAAYSEAIHYALSKAFEVVTKKRASLRPAHEVIEFFEQQMQRNNYCFDDEQYTHKLNLGTSRLKQYLDSYQGSALPHKLEWRLENIQLEGIPVKGILDKVTFTADDQLIVEDIKVLKESTKDYAKKITPDKGGFYRQLAFYNLLILEKFGARYDIVGTQIQYLEKDRNGNLPLKKLTIELEDLEQVKNWVKNTAAAVQKGVFEGCKKEDCHWCNLELQRQRQSSFESIQTDLDDFIEN